MDVTPDSAPLEPPRRPRVGTPAEGFGLCESVRPLERISLGEMVIEIAPRPHSQALSLLCRPIIPHTHAGAAVQQWQQLARFYQWLATDGPDRAGAQAEHFGSSEARQTILRSIASLLHIAPEAATSLFQLKAEVYKCSASLSVRPANFDRDSGITLLKLLARLQKLSAAPLSVEAGYAARDAVECLQVLVAAICPTGSTTSPHLQQHLQAAYQNLATFHLILGECHEAIAATACEAAARSQDDSLDLALFARRQVHSIQLTDRTRCTIAFADGTTIAAAVSAGLPLERLVFASLAHDGLRGVDITYRAIRQSVGADIPSAIHIFRRSESVIDLRFAFPSGRQSEIHLRRDRARIVSPPTHREYFHLPIQGADETGVWPPGRALYPVPYQDWLSRASYILDHHHDLPALMALPPVTVTLGITDACHLDCTFCFVTPEFSQQFGKNYRHGHRFLMAKEDIYTLIESLSDMGVRGIRYVGEGESTLHPHFIDSVMLARARGMRTSVITSGAMLGRNAPLFVAFLDYIRVSWNAGTPHGYAQVHNSTPSQFASVFRGYNELSQRRLAAPGPGPILCCSFVATPHNFDQLPRFLRTVEVVGADYAIVKKDTGWKQTPSEAEAYAGVVATCRSMRFDRDPFVIWAYPQLDLERMQRIPDYEREFNVGCFVHNAGMRANVSYNVAYSCMRHGGPGTILGDLDADTFRSAWSSKARERGATRKTVHDVSAPCPGCFWRDEKFWMSFFIHTLLQDGAG